MSRLMMTFAVVAAAAAYVDDRNAFPVVDSRLRLLSTMTALVSDAAGRTTLVTMVLRVQSTTVQPIVVDSTAVDCHHCRLQTSQWNVKLYKYII